MSLEVNVLKIVLVIEPARLSVHGLGTKLIIKSWLNRIKLGPERSPVGSPIGRFGPVSNLKLLSWFTKQNTH